MTNSARGQYKWTYGHMTIVELTVAEIVTIRHMFKQKTPYLLNEPTIKSICNSKD
ncbi:hypothetical protein PV327_007465, partial [Microctonus hyperodae]